MVYKIQFLAHICRNMKDRIKITQTEPVYVIMGLCKGSSKTLATPTSMSA